MKSTKRHNTRRSVIKAEIEAVRAIRARAKAQQTLAAQGKSPEPQRAFTWK